MTTRRRAAVPRAAAPIAVPLPPGTAAAAAGFRPARAHKLIEDIWSIARRMDSRAVAATAEFAAEELHAAGIETAQVETFPADGVSSAGGWWLPVSWTVDLAVLETALRLGAARENGPAEGGSLMQNLRKDGRGGTRPSRNPRKSPAFANGGPASTPAAGVLQEARGGKGA